MPFVDLAPVRLLRPNLAVLYHVNGKTQRAYLTINHSAILHPEDAKVFEFYKAMTKSILKMGFYETHSVKLPSSIEKKSKLNFIGWWLLH